MAVLTRWRRLIAPEVVQTSAMDCGPAALKSMLAGFGIRANYGRLREACQTDVDGTSINTLEALAGEFGLSAEQVMVPIDHLLLPEADLLPAIVVVRQPDGMTHFVSAWRRCGPLLQVMDPGLGRRWISFRGFLRDVYVHTQRVAASDWRDWASSDEHRRPLLRQLRDLGISRRRGEALFKEASGAASWRQLGTLDAATRLTGAVLRRGGLRRGREAERVLRALAEREAVGPEEGSNLIPQPYWSVLPASQQPESTPDEEPSVRLSGAVLVRVRGRLRKNMLNVGWPPEAEPSPADAAAAGNLWLKSRELAAAKTTPDARPLRYLLWLVAGAGLFSLGLVLICVLLAAGGILVESLLLRGAIDIARDLGTPSQRLVAAGVLVVFAGTMHLLELFIALGLARISRQLEVRLRSAFLAKIPRLMDAYFHSRPISDMAERGHAIHRVRLFPELVGRWLRASLGMLFVAGAIACLNPSQGLVAGAAALVAIVLPLLFHPLLQERDLRVRTLAGVLSRLYFDALQGLSAVRAHGAERAIRREHESLLTQWAQANRRMLAWVVLVEGLQLSLGTAFAAWLVFAYAAQGIAAGSLMLGYWALQLPLLGLEAAECARRYPGQRNLVLRLLEPLGAPESQTTAACEPRSVRRAEHGVALHFDHITVHAAGHTILQDIDVQIEPGSRVAIVGVSGAGKSSLVGLLLGWREPAQGSIRVDGTLLDGQRLDDLREETAWVDPSVQIWNRTLINNLLYGNPSGFAGAIADAVENADLYEVVQRLPAGLQTPLGESGGLVSGGEGQRVRLARAMMRREARLVVLDEPFRGLDRETRSRLLRGAFQYWPSATLLCVTHDIDETLVFERVLVIEQGRVVEDGRPGELAAKAGSRYAELLAAERAVRSGLWSGDFWRRLRLEGGHLQEETRGTEISSAAKDGLA